MGVRRQPLSVTVQGKVHVLGPPEAAAVSSSGHQPGDRSVLASVSSPKGAGVRGFEFKWAERIPAQTTSYSRDVMTVIEAHVGPSLSAPATISSASSTASAVPPERLPTSLSGGRPFVVEPGRPPHEKTPDGAEATRGRMHRTSRDRRQPRSSIGATERSFSPT